MNGGVKVKDTLLTIHGYSWMILAVLFLLTCLFSRQKLTAMILRLFYLVMIITGVWMLILYHFPITPIIKLFLSLILIGFMEMIPARIRRGQSTTVLWILFGIDFIVILLMGYRVIQF
ncbi:DUF1516 family protein [Terrilactibacillus sp. BCM23-1]|uniref:DUF1516 family protein n=1 Tax=Terrilactibacillus tamarindi TaxID=2599694 RepID=A0A6N8CLR1_9BACI|nr:DUF1516 family protein [Terrilactibacillus tamarindi]